MPKTENAAEVLCILVLFVFVFVSRSSAAPDFKTIDTKQLHSMIVDNAYELEGRRAKQFTVIDARTRKEYDAAHIFSAISVPEPHFGKFRNRLPQDKDAILVVYCNDTKCGAARKWAMKAAAAGYRNIVIYVDGFVAWKENKMPIAPF
jgi:rhodanese-related sulfurtransferase